MENPELIAESLANRLAISIDNATLLLLKFKWNEDLIVQNWNLTRSGLVMSSQSDSREASCDKCNSLATCKNFGCSHLICHLCTKVYVEEKITEGELNIKCPIFHCEQIMAPSLFCVDISANHKELFKYGIVQNYHSYKSRNVGLPILLFAKASAFVVSLWRNKWKVVSTLLVAFMICRVFSFCGGGTLQCVVELSVLNFFAHNAWIGSVLKMVLLYLLFKTLFTNSVLSAVLTAVVLSSVVTALLIFKLIAKCLQIMLRFAMSIRRA